MHRRTVALVALLVAALLTLVTVAAADHGKDGGDGKDGKDGKDGNDGKHGKGGDGKEGDGGGKDGKDHDHAGHDAKDRDDRKDKQKGTDEDGSQHEGHPHSSGDDAATETRVLPPDAALQARSSSNKGVLSESFTVSRVGGDGTVSLRAELPQVGAAWRLSGADARSCKLADLVLTCTFQGLPAGGLAVVQASAHAAMKSLGGWEVLASATLRSADDHVSGNDAVVLRTGVFML